MPPFGKFHLCEYPTIGQSALQGFSTCAMIEATL